MPKIVNPPQAIDLDGFAQLATIPETMATIRVSRATINRMIADGRLQAVKIGFGTRITTSSIRHLLASLPAATFRCADQRPAKAEPTN